jgi:hypothetical protein
MTERRIGQLIPLWASSGPAMGGWPFCNSRVNICKRLEQMMNTTRRTSQVMTLVVTCLGLFMVFLDDTPCQQSALARIRKPLLRSGTFYQRVQAFHGLFPARVYATSQRIHANIL